MKPVNLLPAEAAVVSASAGKPNYGMIGGAAVGLVAVVVVAGYFAFARVDSVKSETTAANDRSTKATQETASVRSQIETLGQPVVDSDKQLAQGKEQVLVSAYTERHDFVLLASELRGIMDGTGGWYESIEATAAASSDGTSKGVKIVGYMPTEKLAASFNERVKATKTLKDASVVDLSSEVLTALQTKKPGRYWKFTIQATLVDTVSPSIDGGVGAGSGTGTTVSAGGGDTGALELSLDPEPPAPKPKAVKKAPAKPKNPFDVAASAAITGGGA